MSDRVLYQVEDGIATISLNRPEILNAFDLEMLLEIHELAEQAENDESVAVVIVKGAGRAFSTGADLKARGRYVVENKEGHSWWRRRTPGVALFWILNKATIAQIHGYAVAGGMIMAAMCDITVAATGTKLGYPMVRTGPLVGHRYIYNWLVGPKKTKELLFTGRLVDADEALRIGLVNQVVPPEKLEATVLGLARDIVAIERKNPGFVRANKAAVNSVHPELTNKAFHYWEQNIHAMNEYVVSSFRSQTDFFRGIAEEGLENALERRDGGLVRGGEAVEERKKAEERRG